MKLPFGVHLNDAVDGAFADNVNIFASVNRYFPWQKFLVFSKQWFDRPAKFFQQISGLIQHE